MKCNLLFCVLLLLNGSHGLIRLASHASGTNQAALKVAQQTANAHTIARLEMVIKQKTPKYNWMLNQQKRLEEEKMREKLVRATLVRDGFAMAYILDDASKTVVLHVPGVCVFWAIGNISCHCLDFLQTSQIKVEDLAVLEIERSIQNEVRYIPSKAAFVLCPYL